MEKILYKKSLEARLTLVRGFALEAYQSLMDCALTHKDVKAHLSFNYETVAYNKKPVALIRCGVKNVVVYFALDQAKLAKKFKTQDSVFKMYQDYPAKLVIVTEKDLENAVALMERALAKAGAKEACETEDVDYAEVFYERSFGQLFEAGLIRRYTKNVADVVKEEKEEAQAEEVKAEAVTSKDAEAEEDEEEEAEMSKVTFTVKLRYEAEGTDALYLVTDYVNWDFKKAIRLHRVDSETFTVTEFYPKGTKLEFKICASESWADVEKGIWKEEISNHSYVLADGDMDVEDVIYNFNNR